MNLQQVFSAQGKDAKYSSSGYGIRVSISIDGLFSQAEIKEIQRKKLEFSRKPAGMVCDSKKKKKTDEKLIRWLS